MSNGVGVVMFKASALDELSSKNLLVTGEKVLANMLQGDADHQRYRAGGIFRKSTSGSPRARRGSLAPSLTG